MAPDVVCTGRSFDDPDPFWGSKASLAGNINNKASQPSRLCLVDVIHVLANRWAFLRHHNAGGQLQQRSKTFPHYRADGKAQAGRPAQRCKGRFLSFLFEQAVISWLHLIFIRFSNSLRAVFPFSWQGARGYVIPCDKYILTKAGTVLFTQFCRHPLHKCQDELWHGRAPAHPRHPGIFYTCMGGEKSAGMGGTWCRAGWLNFYWRSLQWGGEGSQDIGFRGDSRALLGSKVQCTALCQVIQKAIEQIKPCNESAWKDKEGGRDSWSRF